jgi:hypothetical protein
LVDGYLTQVLPYRILLPWLLVTLLPWRVFELYCSAPSMLAVRGAVHAHEALNKYRGLASALTKAAPRLPLFLLLSFVAVSAPICTTKSNKIT